MGRKPRVDRSPEEKWQIVQEGIKSGNVSETCRAGGPPFHTTEVNAFLLRVGGCRSMRTKALSRDTCSLQCFAAPLGSQSGGGPKL